MAENHPSMATFMQKLFNNVEDIEVKLDQALYRQQSVLPRRSPVQQMEASRRLDICQRYNEPEYEDKITYLRVSLLIAILYILI